RHGGRPGLRLGAEGLLVVDHVMGDPALLEVADHEVDPTLAALTLGAHRSLLGLARSYPRIGGPNRPWPGSTRPAAGTRRRGGRGTSGGRGRAARGTRRAAGSRGRRTRG